MQVSPLLHDYTTEYMKMGWSVIPIFHVNGECACGNASCDSPGKHPPLYWSKYQLEKATPKALAGWSKRWPVSNVGIVTGAISGLFVVDVDGDEGEVNLRNHGSLPQTPTVKTSKGHHYYFKHPGYDISNRGKFLPKVDTRGDGGYVVLPPSNHLSGITYEWVEGLEPWTVPLADAPRWLLELIQEGKRSRRKAKKHADIAGQVEEGKRNDTLTRLAGSMRRQGFPESSIVLALGDVNEKYCDPPLAEDEVETIAHSVAQYEPAEIIGEVENLYLTMGVSDEGNAQVVARLYGDRLAYTPYHGGPGSGIMSGWMSYSGTHWIRQEGGKDTNRAFTETLIERKKAAQQTEYETLAKFCVPNTSRIRAGITQLAPLVTVGVNQFNSDKDLLNVLNGTVDLRTGELYNHDPNDHFMYVVPTQYNPDAVSHQWEEFLQETVGDYENIREYLQMAVGYSLTGHQNEECFFFLSGPKRSGKGTFTQTLLNVLGSPLGTGVDFASFSDKREIDSNNFDLAGLVQTRLLVCGEVSKYHKLGAKRLKLITGQDSIRCSHKYMEPFEYWPQFKAWFLSNWDINADPDDSALWGRAKVVRFPHSFYGKEDKTLKAKLMTKENREGILAWAIEGARKWYESPTGLITPYEVEQATEASRDELDLVGQFMAEVYEETELEAHFVSNKELYESYKSWCFQHGVDMRERLTQRLLTESFKIKGFNTGVVRRVGRGTARGITGLKRIVEVENVLSRR